MLEASADNPRAAALAPGGDQRTDRMSVTLSAIQYVATGINTYEFRRADSRTLPGVGAGDHIDIWLPNGIVRQYSIINPSPAPNAYRVAVKRDPDSRGGSIYLHDEVRVGDMLQTSSPRNTFPLVESAEHSILIAGGIGITPIFAMVNRLSELGRSWTLHYAVRNRGELAFAEEMKGGAIHLHVDAEQDGRLLDLKRIVESASLRAHLYCCGPKPMLDAFENATRGRSAGQVHVEYFTAKHEAARDGGFVVQLARTGIELFVPQGKSILDVVRDAGVSVPYSCEEGICGSCETRLIAGEPDHRDSVLTDEERAANETLMICCAGCKGDRLVLDL